MSQTELLTVFTYDVSADKRRRRVARLLENAATRVQYSVFETRMTSTKAAALSQRIAAELDSGDSLRVYSIGKGGQSRSRTYGDAMPFEPEGNYWLV